MNNYTYTGILIDLLETLHKTKHSFEFICVVLHFHYAIADFNRDWKRTPATIK